MVSNIRKILLSLLSISAVALLAFGASRAFFSDTETSTGNTFTAGAIDLKVDSEAHYNGLVCREFATGDFRWSEPVNTNPTLEQLAQEHYNEPCTGTWGQTDLGITQQKFFDLADVKPGDDGENTVSLHVYNNDAWGRFIISGVTDIDGTCTEPESDNSVLDVECDTPSETVLNNSPLGELRENMTFYAWLDQGAIPGFQNGDETSINDDTTEGDNVWDCAFANGDPNFDPAGATPENCHEPLVILPGTVDQGGETHNIWTALVAVDAAYCTSAPANGHNTDGSGDYLTCHGLADDGRMVGSATYYFGLAWFIPTTVGNEVQTDSLTADLSFEVVQQRNNPTQIF
ncbi:hypothetical protein A2961_01370 [Candidatus Woesebacteria bacterium RIFCSPLOWO2_01_FULL_39_21]|uniref:Ig-like domain-containing protein n=1 Tax=Candidatus Woesebacteria bacterium RIFCSPLOWO2_01_FULL_39_21 TaxID=1802519 RepID=A0A1F8BKY2_9BACT|nr:MAG: hypothetical protein A2961_01370 [Candidatus Woesebacteria bacterium RIFCSPLOWO2_01_FULL_39_21]